MRTFLVILALAFSSPAWADFSGKVVGVADGDTVTVLDANKQQHKIRLAGIDAPEKGQAFGFRSKENLAKLVYDPTESSCCRAAVATAPSARAGRRTMGLMSPREPLLLKQWFRDSLRGE